jgi:hypothetical protein
MKDPAREAQPVRLPNPTAESFVASLKVVHFFAILFFWLALVALLLHLAAFVVFQAHVFDEALGLTGVSASGEAGAGQGAPAAAPTAEAPREPSEAAPAEAPAKQSGKWWTNVQAKRMLRYTRQLMATMRLVGLLASMLLLVTLFVYLEISLLGRLAGVRYLTLSFFLVLFFVATVYSWEPLLPGTRILGSLFVLDDFLNSYSVFVQRGSTPSLSEYAFHYGRYLVMPIFSFVLLVVAWLQFRKGYEESVLLNE